MWGAWKVAGRGAVVIATVAARACSQLAAPCIPEHKWEQGLPHDGPD
jgi:hypothetical protein